MERRGATLLLLGAAVAYFADMSLPWAGSHGATASGWISLPAWIGAAVSIVLIVLQLFRQRSRLPALWSARFQRPDQLRVRGMNRGRARDAPARDELRRLATYDPELRHRVRAIRILPPIDAHSAE